MKTGVQCFCNALKSLASGFHRNDDSWAFSTFYDGVTIETKEISENLYIDLDNRGNLVSMTVEHAQEKANISEVTYLQMEKIVA